MEKYLRPQRFEKDPNSPTAAKEWLHWYKTFKNFATALQNANKDLDLLNLLINHVSPKIYEHIAECTTYDTAIDSLQELFSKCKNEVVSSVVLTTPRHESAPITGAPPASLTIEIDDMLHQAVGYQDVAGSHSTDHSTAAESPIPFNVMEQTIEVQEAAETQKTENGDASGLHVPIKLPGELWSEEENDALVRAVKRHYHRLTARGFRRKTVWQNISNMLQSIRPGVSPEQCQTRWRKIKALFLKYEDNKKKRATGKSSIPCCYNLLRSFLLDMPGEETEGPPTQIPSSPETQPPTDTKPIIQTPLCTPSLTFAETDNGKTQEPPRKRKRHHPNITGGIEQIIQQGFAEAQQHYKIVEEQNRLMLQAYKESLRKIEKIEREKKDALEKLQQEKNDVLQEKNTLLREKNIILSKLFAAKSEG